MSGDSEPCPCERDAPAGAPGPVDDAETVIRFVPVAASIARDGRGGTALTPMAFPQDELLGRKGKSVSVLREMTAADEVARRGAAINKEPAWADDPVLAKASVRALRQLLDKKRRRELCVNADPVEDNFGRCPTHASVLRASPPPDKTQRLEWTRLRLELAAQFADVVHCSGSPVASPGD